MGKDSLCSWMRSSSKNLSSTSSDMNNNQEVKLYVKTKTWIENAEHELLFGKGKTEILELIEQEGSIAKAAEKLEMSYKKAWTHIKILQKNIADELGRAAKRRRRQGRYNSHTKSLGAGKELFAIAKRYRGLCQPALFGVVFSGSTPGKIVTSRKSISFSPI